MRVLVNNSLKVMAVTALSATFLISAHIPRSYGNEAVVFGAGAVLGAALSGALNGQHKQRKRTSSRKSVFDYRVQEIQSALLQMGYNPGPADGFIGGKTRRAVQAWQRNNGTRITGELTVREHWLVVHRIPRFSNVVPKVSPEVMHLRALDVLPLPPQHYQVYDPQAPLAVTPLAPAAPTHIEAPTHIAAPQAVAPPPHPEPDDMPVSGRPAALPSQADFESAFANILPAS
ncbi:putative peptidoglycan binding domain protein [Pseudovibrio axinellae]|uniref:Putative peptidoglycan binding domain protein n=1 Tax=Pseudovibrio axinellae TaxID=989403 RepID=A0A165UNT3_9HYPH|nr:peptidoglycan-binding domain-containing protein [Pseudovibrio axinellae]KZL12625.1 putative peptidoglycan binding domain protein [Pseudovibrio axinellae]SEP63965.1 Putative peptidoglycan binding domain-containing protein [Pseudovibrio axinellae]